MVIMNLEELSKIDNLIFKYNEIEIKKSFLKQNLDNDIKNDEINYLIEKGTILASSNKFKNRNRALNIATIIPNICSNIEYISGCQNILNKLRNFTAIDVLNKKYPEASNKYISVVDEIRQEYEKISNTENILDQEILFNNTQCAIYRLFNENKDISVSAPTSIGKSFVVIMSLVNKIEKIKKNIVYVVPTRALINQVIEDIRKHLCGDYFVTSSPDTTSINKDAVGIFVLTQERLYNLCNNNNGIDIGLLIIDEAQNIKSGSRGILLEYSIKYAKKIWRNINVIYLSPLINNPSKLLRNNDRGGSFFSKESLVRQNIIKLIRIKGGGYVLKLNNKVIEEKVKIKRGGNLYKSIVNVYSKFNNGEKSIIYCSDTEMIKNVCKELCSRSDIKEKHIDRLDEFADFVAKYINKNYMLVKCIKRGIAFHYGALPSFIRMGVEELAKDGLIDIMVCTSTLLQGINIPAQNIYICNPRAGRKNKFDSLDFWNLIGRAGRIKYDLCGNIILLDTNSWDNIDKYDNDDIELKYATELNNEQIVSLENSMTNVDYRFNPYDDKEKEFSDTIESALVFDNILGEKVNIESTDIENHIKNITNNYREISSLLIKLIGIKAMNIQKVWNIFRENDEEIEKWININPYQEGFIDRYSKIIQLINDNILEGRLYRKSNPGEKENKSFERILYCSNSWIRGNSIRSIIFHDFSRFENEDEVTNVVQKQIYYLNDVIRYKLVKGMYAYQEILKEYLIRTKREKLIEKLPNIAMFLEIGACDDIAIELISLGLIRELAIEITKKYKLNKNNLIKSLKNLDLYNINLNKYSEKRILNFINGL